MLSRRTFLTAGAAGVLTLYAQPALGQPVALASRRTGMLAADRIPQFRSSLLVPKAMPVTRRLRDAQGSIDYYEIAARQFGQQMLPSGFPKTTVWGYGPAGDRDTRRFSTPSMTIETDTDARTRVRWVNELVDKRGRPLPPLLPVDPTLHWANPEQIPGEHGAHTDTRPLFTGRHYVPPSKYTDPATQYTCYRGPVPLVAHLHGSVQVGDESDGYPEAWTLPAGALPSGMSRTGRWYDFFAAKAAERYGVRWAPGTQICQYPGRDESGMLWFHDHALGITRLNVYAGLVGLMMMREPSESAPTDKRTGRKAVLPGDPGSSCGAEVPLAIQDRAFNRDGSLFYPDARSYFGDTTGPFVPESPISPVWNPEFFGNVTIVNGRTWPRLDVQQRRYRLRILNGCNSRVLILNFGAIPGASAWVIGNEGGYLPEPHNLAATDGRVVLAPAERLDIIVDFSRVPVGRHVLTNLGPDGPYSGGEPGTDFDPANPATTGRVMQFRVSRRSGTDRTTPPEHLVLPQIARLPEGGTVRRMALLEHAHETSDGDAPAAAMLGSVEINGSKLTWEPKMWMSAVTENPAVGATETWEVFNFTEDAHPVHLHAVTFEVLDRAKVEVEPDGSFTRGEPRAPHPHERGRKDTVIAEPEQVTRIRATFGTGGQFVWHCHILEHEDNEMMRPFRIGGVQSGQPH